MVRQKKRKYMRNILQMLKDCKLLKYHRSDHAGIMSVVDLIRDTLTSPTEPFNAIMPGVHNPMIFVRWIDQPVFTEMN